MIALRVRIADLVFLGSGGNRDDKFRFVLSPDGFTGWEDGVAMRREETPLPMAHGSFDAPGFGASRVPVLKGNCIARTPADLVHAGRKLTGLLADGGTDVVVVERDGLTTWANVGLAPSSSTKFVTRGFARRTAEFQLQLWAADPRIFGEIQSFTGASVTVFHYGNFPADPVITVPGPRVGGYTITGPGGAAFTVTQDPGAGHTHTIDFATGLVLLDGVVQSGVVTNADTWTIAAGQQVPMAISAGSMTVAVKDTYI